MSRLSFLKDFSYYFTARPSVGNFTFFIPLVLLFGLMFVLSLYAKYIYSIKNRQHRAYKLLGEKLYSWLITISLSGLIYLFFRYEGIMFLSARILLIIILVICLYWGYTVWQFYQADFKQIIEKSSQKQEKYRYFPKKKK